MKSGHTTWHKPAIGKALLEKKLGQKGAVLWFTGLSGSGKSTLANALAEALFAQGHVAFILDGDNVRHGLCGDLGFSSQDRDENVRRVAHVARLFSDAGIIALAALISPLRAQREMARGIAGGHFAEIHVRADLATCEARDPKGLYKKARNNEIPAFTGISSPYEEPENAELVLDTQKLAPAEAVAEILKLLQDLGVIGA
jgi:adenylylsulfate kinase